MLNKHDEDYIFIRDLKKAKKYHARPSLLKHCWKFDKKSHFARWIVDPDINKGNPLPDYISFYGVPFTMEEYDMSGRTVLYSNIKLGIQIEVDHINRYKDMSSITDIQMYELSSFRNDITYLE